MHIGPGQSQCIADDRHAEHDEVENAVPPAERTRAQGLASDTARVCQILHEGDGDEEGERCRDLADPCEGREAQRAEQGSLARTPLPITLAMSRM